MSPIVLIHGMWSHPGVVLPLGEVLTERGHQVHVPALRGHDPRSPLPPDRLGRLSVTDFAEGLRKYIEDRGFDRPPVLVGHSMGGLLAQMVASRMAVESLVLLNSAGPAGVNHLTVSAARSSLNVLATPRFWDRPHLPSFERARYALFNELDPAVAREVHSTLLPESGRCYAEIVFWGLDPRRATRIRDPIRAPVLVVSAGRDHIVHPSVSRSLAKRYPRARLRLYPKNGHWLFHEPGSDRIFADVSNWIEARETECTTSAGDRCFIDESVEAPHEDPVQLRRDPRSPSPSPAQRPAGLDRAVDDAGPLRGDPDEDTAPDGGPVLPR